MARSKETKIELTAYDDLFETDQSREEAKLSTLLNIDGKGQAHTEAVVAKSTRTSVLDSLKRPATPRNTEKKPKQHEEVR